MHSCLVFFLLISLYHLSKELQRVWHSDSKPVQQIRWSAHVTPGGENNSAEGKVIQGRKWCFLIHDLSWSLTSSVQQILNSHCTLSSFWDRLLLWHTFVPASSLWDVFGNWGSSACRSTKKGVSLRSQHLRKIPPNQFLFINIFWL